MKSIWVKSLCMTAISVAAATLVAGLLRVPAQSILGLDPYSYEKIYYQIVNSKERGNDILNPQHNILIYAIDSIADSRKQIAQVVEAVMKYSPAAVGLDIRFDQPHGEEDQDLEKTIKKYGDKLVLAAEYDNPNYLYSYFGDLNGYADYGDVSTPSILTIHRYGGDGSDKSLETFAYKLAAKANLATLHKGRRHIDFTNKEFTPYYVHKDSVSTFFDIPKNHEYIENSIVLIGGIHESYDMHYSPFKINGEHKHPGVVYISYQTYALIDRDGYLKEMPVLWDVIICFVLVFLCSITYCLIDERINYHNENKRFTKQYVLILSKGFWLVLMEAIVAIICTIVGIWCFKILPDCLYYLIAVLFLDCTGNFYNAWIKNHKKI